MSVKLLSPTEIADLTAALEHRGVFGIDQETQGRLLGIAQWAVEARAFLLDAGYHSVMPAYLRLNARALLADVEAPNE